MTIYTFPAELWKTVEVNFTLAPLSASSPQSAFNPFMFTDGPITEFWTVQVQLKSSRADGWRPIAALLRKLRGRRNQVRLFDPVRKLRGAGGAAPVINIDAGAVAGATSITVYGLKPSEAVALAADDFFGVGENLHAVSDDCASDADGKATISFLPPLRQGVANGDPVNLLYPTGLFQLVGGADAQVVVGNRRQALQLQFGEDPDFD